MKNSYQRLFLESNFITKLGLLYFGSAVFTFLAVSVTFPFFGSQFEQLNPKPASSAQESLPSFVLSLSPTIYRSNLGGLTAEVNYPEAYTNSFRILGSMPGTSRVRLNGVEIIDQADNRWETLVSLNNGDNTILLEALGEDKQVVDSLRLTIHRGIQCDINKDERVNFTDVSLLSDILNGKLSLHNESALRADCNQDGKLDMFDLGIVVSLSGVTNK